MTDQTHGRGTGEPARLPSRMTYETEFLSLLDQRRRIDRRLNELVEVLDHALGRPGLKLSKGSLPSAVSCRGTALPTGGRR